MEVGFEWRSSLNPPDELSTSRKNSEVKRANLRRQISNWITKTEESSDRREVQNEAKQDWDESSQDFGLGGLNPDDETEVGEINSKI